MILPKTIILKPFVKVCIPPPTVKMRAPARRVILLPIISPILPEINEVTIGNRRF